MSGTTNDAAGLKIPAAILSFLIEHGLATDEEIPTGVPLTGGVSSELWRVELPHRTICVKSALERLKVEGDWYAPVSRNTVEWNWITFARTVVPSQVPEPLAHDEDRGLFAMSYLPVGDYPVWKARLLAGSVHQADAAGVGTVIGRLHAASAGAPHLARRFATDSNFASLRINPYMVATMGRHPDLSAKFRQIIERTATTRLAVVHGDVSPKNILLGPAGPILLDAECGWYGDPAFDLAFVVNHLMLKTLVVPGRREALTASARALVRAYVDHVTWEPVDEVLARAGALLPALLLARVDGLSPVEYLDPGQRSVVRVAARKLIAGPESTLPAVITETVQLLDPTDDS